MDDVEDRIINRIQASRQYLVGDYPYFVWPYKGIDAICPDELSWLVANLAMRIPPGTDTLLSMMTDGDLLTMPLAFLMKLPVIICRDTDYHMIQPLTFIQKTGYYSRNLYLARPRVGSKICIVEAIVSTGGTICAAGTALRGAGCVLTGIATAIQKLDFNGGMEIEKTLSLIPNAIFTVQEHPSTKSLIVKCNVDRVEPKCRK